MVACPLVVDLDGTLLDSDLLVESSVAYLRSSPLAVFRPLFWLLGSGKAGLKENIASRVSLDVTVLPYNRAVISYIADERAKGRQVVLATASHISIASRIAEHLQLFDRVLATDGEINLSGSRKAERLFADYGDKGFDYMGNASVDLPVWKHARRAYVVNASKTVVRLAKAQGNVAQVIETRGAALLTWLKALRFHQWMKNLLIFAPC